MVKQESLDFLKDLKNNNTKEWFEANRERYHDYKEDILSFTATLLDQLTKLDASISTASLDPKKCLTRINRDLRF